MRTFNRVAMFAFLLSLGHVAHALPPAHRTGLIAHRQHNIPDYYNGKTGSYGAGEDTIPSPGDQTTPGVDVQGEAWTLKGRLDPKVGLMTKVKTIEDAKANVEDIIFVIKEESLRLTDISANLNVEAHIKIARVITRVFIELVSACRNLSLKFSAPLVIDDLAAVDEAFLGYLMALTTHVPELKKVLVNNAINMKQEATADLGVSGLVRCTEFLGLSR